ncbi:hypothetical protein [Marinicella meishanensis]|uniref:hypothetical protein n=1 Tax=Marinicella meishanensis TaxID=2873263 RepID=UPI001CC0EFD5|nr:hypothetical protein [Marinicella sp. NBU2979]
MTEDDITITINGETHRFKSGDAEAMQNMPWPQRKKLIDLLESIRQAEFVAAAQSQAAAEPVSPQPSQQPVVSKTAPKQRQPAATQLKPTPTKPSDLGVDASRQSPEDLMQQLIMQEKQHSHSIPDRLTVVKYMLAVIVLIILLSMLF